MKYAVIRIQGKQYKISEGESFLVDKITGDKPVCDVLLVKDEDELYIGEPVVKNAKIELKMTDSVEKGEKIEVFKYKSKSRYRKRMGFRPKYSRILVEKISAK